MTIIGTQGDYLMSRAQKKMKKKTFSSELKDQEMVETILLCEN